jgi:hypothetical protein
MAMVQVLRIPVGRRTAAQGRNAGDRPQHPAADVIRRALGCCAHLGTEGALTSSMSKRPTPARITACSLSPIATMSATEARPRPVPPPRIHCPGSAPGAVNVECRLSCRAGAGPVAWK